MAVAIRFDKVSKLYRLGENQRALRHAIASVGRSLRGRTNRTPENLFWALREVSFEVDKGQALGIIGPNGAGKTTTLKLLSRITQPTSGRIQVNGRVSALIELGAGFHPDLTGRENIYLNGAILGLKRREVDRKFDSIVAFSGLEQFIDTPVKRYSSGMYVRLGFSVAAHVEPEVLLVDEVLSVGDSDFRQKCAQRIEELRRLGTTIVFVSHNLYLVQSVCERSIFLAGGQIHASGKSSEVIEAYESWLRSAYLGRYDSSNGHWRKPDDWQPVEIVQVTTRCLDHQNSRCRPEHALEIQIHYRAQQRIVSPRVYVKILRADGVPSCMIRSSDYGYQLEDLVGEGSILLTVDPLQLTPGVYVVDAEILGALEGVALAERFSPPFEVVGSTVGHEGFFVPSVRDLRMVQHENTVFNSNVSTST